MECLLQQFDADFMKNRKQHRTKLTISPLLLSQYVLKHCLHDTTACHTGTYWLLPLQFSAITGTTEFFFIQMIYVEQAGVCFYVLFWTEHVVE